MAVVFTDDIQAPSREPKEHSRPISLWLPSEFKEVDLNPRKGLVTAYLTVYNNLDGTPFIDPYLDIIEPGSFKKTINDLNQARQRKSNPYLCASLWQHDRKEVIGGVKALTEDSKGVVYEAQLLMNVQRAREAFELAAAKMVGSSFGYDPIRFEHKGDIRHLIELRLHEQSLVTFPANDLAPILDTKNNKTTHYVPPNFPEFPDIPNEQEYAENVVEELLAVTAVCGSVTLPIGEYGEKWDAKKAHKQYEEWAIDRYGKAIAERYKQVHLKVDGSPVDSASYAYPYCYIVEGKPRICVAAVEGLALVLGRDKEQALKTRWLELSTRINKKYPQEKALKLPSIDGLPFEYKQDFSEAWTQKLPGMLMGEFFRMADTLTYVLMSNFTDDDVADKTSMIDTCTAQFADRLKSWYPEYAAADAAQDALEGDDADDMPLSMMSADISSINIKRALEQVKAGRRLSEATRKKLQASIDKINSHVVEIQTFIAGDITDESDEPKSVLSPEYIFDITNGLGVLDTLAPGHRPQAPQAQKAHSPLSSFPTLEDAEYEVDITDLLASIQESIKGG